MAASCLSRGFPTVIISFSIIFIILINLPLSHAIPSSLPLSDPFGFLNKYDNKTIVIGKGGCQEGTCAEFERNWYQFEYSSDPQTFYIPLTEPFVINFLDGVCASANFQMTITCGMDVRNLLISSTGAFPQNYATPGEALSDINCASTIGLAYDMGNAFPFSDPENVGPYPTCTLSISSSEPGTGWVQVQPYYGTTCKILNLFGNRYYLIQASRNWIDPTNGISPQALCASFNANLLFQDGGLNTAFIINFFQNLPCPYKFGTLFILGDPNNLLGTAQGTNCYLNNIPVMSTGTCSQFFLGQTIPVICYTVIPAYLGQYIG